MFFLRNKQTHKKVRKREKILTQSHTNLTVMKIL